MTTRERILLFIIASLGFTLRASGASFGLPLLSNLYIRPDETLVAIPALELFQLRGDPGFYQYPALLTYLYALLIRVLYSISTSGMAAPPPVGTHFFENTVLYWTALRLLSALFGTATIILVYGVSRRVAGQTASLWAALLYAAAPLPVRDSHFAVTDALLAALVALALDIACSPAPPTRRRAAVLGCVTAAAAGTKYSGALLIPVCILALVRFPMRPRRIAVLLGMYGVVAASVFTLLNPYLFANFERLAEFASILKSTHLDSHGGRSIHLSSWSALPFGAGGFCGLVLAAIGAADSVVRRSRSGLTILAGAAAFAAPLLFSGHIPFRYLLPSMPLLAALTAAGIEALARPGVPRFAAPAALVILGAFAVHGAMISANGVVSLRKPDTRTLAGDWIRANVSPALPIALLTPPECEPQLAESADSIDRRIGYVSGLYGPKAGAVVARPYRVMRDVASSRSGGYEVYRGAAANGIHGPAALVVSRDRHPLGNSEPGAVSAFMENRRVLRRECIRSGRPLDEERGALDLIDAFFLPLGTSSAGHPGPDICISLTTSATP